ncbi:MFS transporter [Desulfosporosinus youngiae]|uniref:Arabinose efflux permease family protein n=1 Tax=Desulfosporosinus youngiae DSM 17734 TaxID=768710 RepID=H5XUW0_9FIRM|nr:MFS transporter [Desulfosporosinus youngiae]EHQ89412.1 arabinose efflux permease family protein [Desulfosporosinus youngiae DSM 17734]
MNNQRVTPIPDRNAPLNGSMIVIWIFAWLALVLDVMDWQLVSVSAKAISTEFNIPASMMGFVLGAPLLGAGLGGLISGVLSDKLGRVRVMFWCLIWYSLFTIAFAYANSIEMMLALRFLVGIGLGAQWGVGNTLVAECLPSRMRIMCSAVIQTGFAFGPMLAAFLAKTVMPTYGWRSLFWFGAIGIVVAIAAKIFIAEPEAWVRSKEHATASGLKMGSLKRLFSTEIYDFTGTTIRRNTIGAFFLVVFSLLAYWSAMSWIPSWLATDKHMDIVKSMNYMMFLNIGGVLGYVLFAFIADRWGRKKPAYVALSASFIAVLIFVRIGDNNTLLMFAPVYAFITYPIFGLFGGYMAELFPTDIRGTGVNTIYNLARMMSFWGPAMLGAIAALTSFSFAIGASAFLYLCAIVPLIFLPETIKKAVSRTGTAIDV